MFSARVLPDGVCDAGDGRPVRTSLRRGPAPVVLLCGECANWLAVGHHPHDAEVRAILLVCAACHRINDPARAAERTGPAAGDPPAELSHVEVWGRSVVERVHVLATQERRWPWRADAG